MKYLISLLLVTLLAFGEESTHDKNINSYHLYPDEYSELDDIPTPISTNDEFIVATLELAREKYIQALIFWEQSDTLRANEAFEKAVSELNSLISYPGINQNPDFIDLASQLIEDYKDFATKFDIISENSPMFIINEQFLDESDDIADSDIEIKTLKDLYEEKTGIKVVNPEDLEIPLPENQYVKKSIVWLTEKPLGRKWTKKVIERTTKFFPMFRRIAKEEGLPEEIIYLSIIESALETNALSKASAVGLWQFMEYTGKDFGLNLEKSTWIDERRDPEKSTRAAMHYLSYLHEMFGDWHLAIASYNCGQGRVQRAIKRSGLKEPTFWNIRSRLPKQTKHYVPMYIATALVVMQPEAYGFNVDSLDFKEEYKYDLFPVREPVNLEAIAKAANTTLEEIRNLNPELTRSTTPPDVDEYYLKIPFGNSKEFFANYSLLTEEEKQPWVEHIILRNETINKIAIKYNVSKQELVELNGYRSSSTSLRRGRTIKIPISTNDYNEINLAANRTGTYFPMDGKSNVIHTVKRGESLYKIAQDYGVPASQVRELNGLTRKNPTLQIGQSLLIAKRTQKEIPAGEIEKDNVKMLAAPVIVRHKVKRKETLSQIADLYKIKVDDIKEANKLTSNTLRTGSYLKIKTKVDPNSFKSVASAPSQDLASHKVRRGETLGKIADRYGMTLSELRAENNLHSNKIYPGQRLKVYGGYSKSSGSSTSIARSTNTNSGAETHKVRRGESLYIIANRYGLTVNQLKEINDLGSNSIYPGQRLKVRYAPSTQINNSPAVATPSSFVYHTVKRGETLGHIAENYGVLAREIRSWNGMSGSMIHPGDKLKISSNKRSDDIVSKDLEKHTVKKGETVSSIASLYGVSENQIKSWNDLNGNTIYAGKDLYVKEPELSKGSNKPAQNTKSTASYYTLKKGENLYVIAKKFGVSVNSLKKLNPNLNEKRLQIGQKIRIK